MKKVEVSFPAVVVDVALPLTGPALGAFVAKLGDLWERWLQIAATNRLKRAEYEKNSYWQHAGDLVQWTLREDALVAAIEADGDDEDARATLHYIELAWAACWTQHPHETSFARPLSPLDVTITLDPEKVVAGTCTCGLCTYFRPRITKWAIKRAGLAELYKRIGLDETVSAAEILPLIGNERLKTATKKAPKKTDQLSAKEAKAWLSLNPNRAW